MFGRLILVLSFIFLIPSLCLGSIEFDNVDDDFVCGTDAIIDYERSNSISAWINPDSQGEGGFGRIFFRRRSVSSTGGISLLMADTNTLELAVNFSSGALLRESNNDAITLNEWQHVALVWDGSITAANAKLYVNGVETSYSTTTDGAGSGVTLTTNFIGNRDDDRTFDGEISDLCICNMQWTDNEVVQLASSRRRHTCLNICGDKTTAYWTMDDVLTGTSADGDILYDHSGNDRDCTGSDGTNNTGLTSTGGQIQGYP